MTAEKLADAKSVVEQFGANGFRQFQESRRASTPQGEARRQQIETLAVDGNRAVLTARKRHPGAPITREQYFTDAVAP